MHNFWTLPFHTKYFYAVCKKIRDFLLNKLNLIKSVIQFNSLAFRRFSDIRDG
jgi:hypothetical protein